MTDVLPLKPWCGDDPCPTAAPSIRDAALAYHRAGLCVLPTVPGEKRPAGNWKAFVETRPDEAATAAMFQHAPGVCIVGGPVSGHVECLDFDDGGSAFADWSATTPRPLFDRLVVEQTPSGGFHVAYRCPDAVLVDNTRKLARSESGACLIETRGTGAVFLCDPSPGYRLIQGCFTTLPDLSPAERDCLLNAAVALDRYALSSTTTATPALSAPLMTAGVGDVPAYVRAALDGECAKVTAAVEGSRNDTLNVAAVKIGHFVGAYPGFEATARAALTAAALYCGLEPAAIAATLHSGFRKGASEPKAVPSLKTASQATGNVDLSALLAKAGTNAPPRVEAADPDKHPGWRITFMSDIKEEAIRWLWPERIACGKLNMLVGDPGLGKSYITCDLAARVSTGRAWPDGAPGGEPGTVLILNAEDPASDTLKPRFRVSEADMSRIATLQAVSDRNLVLSVARNLDAVEYAAAQLPDLRLIVIDPISAFMGGVDSHKNADVREALAPLSALAERLGTALLVVSHLNKGDGPAVYRTTGSLAFTAVARCVWALAKDKRDSGRRLFVPVKCNVAGDRSGLAYRLNKNSGVWAVDGKSQIAALAWDPTPLDMDADEALAAPARQGPAPKRRMTAVVDEWLEAFLAQGKRPAAEVVEAGKGAGFSKDQLYRSRERIGAMIDHAGYQGKFFWHLPESGLVMPRTEASIPPEARSMPTMPIMDAAGAPSGAYSAWNATPDAPEAAADHEGGAVGMERPSPSMSDAAAIAAFMDDVPAATSASPWKATAWPDSLIN